MRQRGPLRPVQFAVVLIALGPFQRQRVMHDRHDAEPFRMIDESGLERRQRQAVDHDEPSFRQGLEQASGRFASDRIRQRIPAGQLVNRHRGPRPSQLLDDAPVIDVPAGPLIERPWYDEGEIRRNHAQATGPS